MLERKFQNFLQANFKVVSGKLKERVMSVSKVFPGGLKCVSRVVSRKFEEYFQCVSNKLYGY